MSQIFEQQFRSVLWKSLGLTILLLFPFTRLVHMLSAPVRYVWRPGYQVVRSRKLAR